MNPASGPGLIVAIGGRETRDEAGLSVLKRFSDACGGETARLLLITNAKPEPWGKIEQYTTAFDTLGVPQPEFFHFDSAEDDACTKATAALEYASGVFFTGGSQQKLMNTLNDTQFVHDLRSRHRHGMPVGGSSAGASAMSRVMLARGERDEVLGTPLPRLSNGLGFFPEAIIDQHFGDRKRHWRLIATIGENPSLLGLGLDEATGFALENTGKLCVLGRGALTIVDGSAMQRHASDRPAEPQDGFSGLRIHRLLRGWQFDLASRQVRSALESR